jgi:hypothetical protein
MNAFRSGLIRGTGAAVNVELGFIPDLVIVTNHTDGDKIHIGQPGRQIIVFTSGSLALAAGQIITGATSGATATIVDVLLDSGSYAGGDAAGWIVIDVQSKTGTFGTENIYVSSDGTSGVNDATIVVDVTYTQDIDTEVAGATGNAAITAYVGTEAGYALGFTIGSTISEDAKLLGYHAWRQTSGPNRAANSL